MAYDQAYWNRLMDNARQEDWDGVSRSMMSQVDMSRATEPEQKSYFCRIVGEENFTPVTHCLSSAGAAQDFAEDLLEDGGIETGTRIEVVLPDGTVMTHTVRVTAVTDHVITIDR